MKILIIGSPVLPPVEHLALNLPGQTVNVSPIPPWSFQILSRWFNSVMSGNMMNLETILVQHGAKVIMMIVHGKLVKAYLEGKRLQGSRQCLSQKFKPLGQKEFLLITCENNLSGKVERIPPSSPWMPYWMMV